MMLIAKLPHQCEIVSLAHFLNDSMTQFSISHRNRNVASCIFSPQIHYSFFADPSLEDSEKNKQRRDCHDRP